MFFVKVGHMHYARQKYSCPIIEHPIFNLFYSLVDTDTYNLFP